MKKLIALFVGSLFLGTVSFASAEQPSQSLLLLNQGMALDPGAGKIGVEYNIGATRRTCLTCSGARAPSIPDGVEQTLGARYGVGPFGSISGGVILAPSNNLSSESINTGGYVEVGSLLVNPVKFSGIALGIAGGALNTGGLNRIRGRVQAEKNFGKLSLATQGLVEHAFQAGADGVDVYASVGASYEVASGLGAGIEYTAQDIEALVGDDAEGGARQMFGPTMVWHPQAMPVRLLFGPAVAIGPEGTRAVGRMTFSYSF